MESFEYIRPKSVEEACVALKEVGGTAKVLAGGTDILVQMKRGTATPAALVSLRDVPELRFVRPEADGGVVIGAATRLIDIERSAELRSSHPAVAEAAAMIGSVQVRDRATIGGNLCNASPSADTAPILIALGAWATITDGRQEQKLPLEEFFTGPGQSILRPGQILSAITVPPVPARSFAKYYKTFRSAMDCCTVGVAAKLTFSDQAVVEDARIALGAVAPTPIRAPRCEKAVVGKTLDEGLIARVGGMAAEEARPISDVRASADYRRVLAEVLTRRALAEARTWLEKGADA